MSTNIQEIDDPVEKVDVDPSALESVSKNSLSCDSGVDSCSTVLTGSSDSDASPIKTMEHENQIIFVDVDNNAEVNVPETKSSFSSPETTPTIHNDNVSSILSSDNHLLPDLLDHNSPKESFKISCNFETISNTSIVLDAVNHELDNNEDMYLNKDLTTSSTSLNNQNECNIIISKSHSKSADNLSSIEPNNSNKDLNKEKILNEFTYQKNKVAATQKITADNIAFDLKQTRIPKEILSQDLGSIVKNVHGIFSSVSGSLKNAYNNSHRVSLPNVKNYVKPVPNGKVMNDIFEDEIVETPIEAKENIPNLNESFIIETESDLKEEKDISLDLEKLVDEQRRENVSLKERLRQVTVEMQSKDVALKELEGKLDLMSKRLEVAAREKDAAVMRYASVECAAIEAKRAADKAAAAERAAITEMELMGNKLKSANSEKQRICQLYDDKCHELSTSERELAKVRDDIKELEGRLKWTQSKLRMEMEAYKESSERVEKLSQQVSELEGAREAAAANATDSVRAKQLESELKECRAALILCRHEKEDLDRRLSTITQQYDTCKRERDSATSSLALATDEVEKLKEANLRLEEEAAELAALRAQAALADTLSAQLQRETARAEQAEECLGRERARAETCRRREAAALQHAASVTASQVRQRALAENYQDKAQALELDNASLRERLSALESEILSTKSALSQEKQRREDDNNVLARRIAELTEELADVNKKLEWEKGENSVLKKKHSSAVKELNRELQRSLKRCEQLEAKLSTPDATSTRTGSVSSLSSNECPPQDDRLQNGHTDAVPEIQIKEPDRQTLIERIVSLQRAAARRSERCEFLEEHARQLTAELRNKSRVLRSLLATQRGGDVATPASDDNKKEIARLGGGAMAALYGGAASGISPELSLEMNKKLQALLEDTLLKNIMLKENMDTLGEEIARLKGQKKNGK